MRPVEPLNGPADEEERGQRESDTARIRALADVYVYTNLIRDRIEDRLEAIGRALGHGATPEEMAQALGGHDIHDTPEEEET